MTFEEKYEDILQNLEFAIIQVYRERPDLIDAEVLMAIESLIRVYGALFTRQIHLFTPH